jgi:glycosyltransferase involved in cell wall biosynthesis
MERLPRITIVTPSLQQGSFLEQTIRSVLDQRDVEIDYIVQDGGSTDNSVPLVRRYAARLAHWESIGDGGQADAIVRGFSHGAGRPDDLMMYLNSDDTLMEGAARFVAEYFAQHPEVDVAYGHRVLIDDHGREIGRWFTPRLACSDLRLHDFIPQETLFWRRRIWDRVGGIDTSFRFALDWDLLLRFSAAGARFARLPWFLGGFRLHSRQKTTTLLQDDGIPEMDALRRRTLGRTPTHDELHLAMRRAQLDSALVCALFQRGWRV